MKAVLLERNELYIEEGLWAAIVIWQVPVAVRGSDHLYKYRIALIDHDKCVLRYDNEAGKGDHKHVGDEEFSYTFTTVRALRRDFMKDIAEYRKRR